MVWRDELCEGGRAPEPRNRPADFSGGAFATTSCATAGSNVYRSFECHESRELATRAKPSSFTTLFPVPIS